jgi:hypothetical protein
VLGKLRQLRLRTLAAPVQVAVAAIIAVQAVIALGGWGLVDPIGMLLPSWLATTFNVAYLVAGVAWLLGMLLARWNVEAFGLALLSTAITARGVMFGALLGWGLESISSLVFSWGLALAFVARIWVLWHASAVRKEPG